MVAKLRTHSPRWKVRVKRFYSVFCTVTRVGMIHGALIDTCEIYSCESTTVPSVSMTICLCVSRPVRFLRKLNRERFMHVAINGRPLTGRFAPRNCGYVTILSERIPVLMHDCQFRFNAVMEVILKFNNKHFQLGICITTLWFSIIRVRGDTLKWYFLTYFGLIFIKL